MSEIVGTGRHLTKEQLTAWTGFLDSGRMLEQVLADHLSESHGLTHREYEILVRLDGAGGRLRMSVLATQIVASAPLITQTVRRLEDRRWVEKRPAVGDQRGVDAVLLPAGSDALREAAKGHAELIKELLLDPLASDLPTFARGMALVADHFRAHRAGSPCPIPTCSLT